MHSIHFTDKFAAPSPSPAKPCAPKFSVEGDTTRTRCEFVNELNGNMVQFARIRDENIIPVLFSNKQGRQRFISYYYMLWCILNNLLRKKAQLLPEIHVTKFRKFILRRIFH